MIALHRHDLRAGDRLRQMALTGRGDELIEVVVETPRHLTPRQEELLREFAEIEHEQVSPRRRSFFEKLRDYFTEETDAPETGHA